MTTAIGNPRLDAKALGYNPSRQIAAYRTGIGAAIDNVSVGGATFLAAVDPIVIPAGQPTLVIAGRATNASATIGVRVAYFFVDPITGTRYLLGISAPLVLTASGTLRDATPTNYLADDVYLDTRGANEVRVFVSTVSSAGTWDLWAGVF